jgi:hypothetical protein
MLVHADPPFIPSISSIPSSSSSVVSVVFAPSSDHLLGCPACHAILGLWLHIPPSCCSQHFALGCFLLHSLVSPLPAQEPVVAQLSSAIASNAPLLSHLLIGPSSTPSSGLSPSNPEIDCLVSRLSRLNTCSLSAPAISHDPLAHTCRHCHAHLSNVWPTSSAAPTTINIVASAGRQLASQCLT